MIDGVYVRDAKAPWELANRDLGKHFVHEMRCHVRHAVRGARGTEGSAFAREGNHHRVSTMLAENVDSQAKGDHSITNGRESPWSIFERAFELGVGHFGRRAFTEREHDRKHDVALGLALERGVTVFKTAKFM